LSKYQTALIERFRVSPEGQPFSSSDEEVAFWSENIIDFGYRYLDVSIPQMSVHDMEELLTTIFPRKISLQVPKDADGAIAEMLAFWQFLQREYKLPQAANIIKFLEAFPEEKFLKMMFDPARAGMAKSFFMSGQSAGYDMTDEKQAHQFMALYNASQLILTEQEKKQQKKNDVKEKKKLKAAKAARKRNKKRK
jgi:hypothetical protein